MVWWFDGVGSYQSSILKVWLPSHGPRCSLFPIIINTFSQEEGEGKGIVSSSYGNSP